MLTQPLFYCGYIDRHARIEQSDQRCRHLCLALACRQVQDAQVLLGRPRRLPLHEQVVGHAEATAGEQIRPIAVVREGSRLAHQPVNDVPVVDTVLAASAQTRQRLQQLLAVPHFDPLGVQTGL